MYLLNNYKNDNYRKYLKSNLPMKYVDSNINDFKILGDNSKEKQFNEKMYQLFNNYCKDLNINLKNGFGLTICGSVGIAKTWLLTHLAKKVIEEFDIENIKIQDEDLGDGIKFNKFYYIQATTLSQMIFRTGLTEEELKVRSGIKTIAGLWIDDISKISETKTSVEISFFDDIIRYRDLNKLTTFYTSQVPFEELSNALSKPIFDIIRGNTLQLTFRGESQR